MNNAERVCFRAQKAIGNCVVEVSTKYFKETTNGEPATMDQIVVIEKSSGHTNTIWKTPTYRFYIVACGHS
jgi:hypothetical protein